MIRPSSPATSAPISGKKTMAWITRSALELVDVLNRDCAAVAVEDNENGKADRGLGGGDGQDQEREDLPGNIAELCGEGHEVDVDREQDQLDRHQDDDDILAVEENPEHAEREQDRADR